MFVRFITAACICALSAVAAIADPVGQYTTQGSNPGKPSSTYSGTVKVQRTGDTYQVTWDIEGQIYTGTGIGSKDFLAVSYRSGNETGLALYAQQPNGTWEGIWTYAGGRSIGTDRWTPR